MGLPVSNSLAILMGGKLGFESVYGTGSVFTLTVPLGVPGEKSEGEINNREVMDALRGMRVLVAEDNVINQMIIEELLTSAGMEATIAENGVTALEKLKNGAFDVVLMDIQMPELDGLAATVQIRADSRYENIPVIAMTANAEQEHIAESFSAGMNDHLTKPIDVDKLYETLLKWKR